MVLSKRAQSNQVLTFERRNPLLCISSAVSSKTAASTFNEQYFDNMAYSTYLGKLCIMYDAENVGLSHFSSDENKGSQSIAEICCSVIKPLITDSMVSIRLIT